VKGIRGGGEGGGHLDSVGESEKTTARSRSLSLSLSLSLGESDLPVKRISKYSRLRSTRAYARARARHVRFSHSISLRRGRTISGGNTQLVAHLRL